VHLLVLRRKRFPAALHGVSYRLVDLTLPAADRKLMEVFGEDEVDTVLHAAFFTDPRRDTSYATSSNPSAP
jgi:hypothetical protein